MTTTARPVTTGPTRVRSLLAEPPEPTSTVKPPEPTSTVEPAEPAGTVLGASPGAVESLTAYLDTGGYRQRADDTPGELLAHLADAGLRGRGGAAFPAATKLAAVRDAGGAPVVVANGEEGEPGSVKDRWLLRARPHLVLDGLARAASITGARHGYVYVADPVAAERVRGALAERAPASPLDTVEVVETGHTYVAGEESAVVRRIDGGPALPLAKPPRPYQSGVGGEPTLVANVESLARIALIAARPDRRHRIARTTLLTLAGPAGTEPLLTEAPYGTTLRRLARAQGTRDARAALMGGLFGGLVGEGALDLPVDPDRLAEAGTALGCAAIRFLGPDDCPVSTAADAAAHLAAESARQCGVCVAGSGAVRDTLGALAAGRAPDGAVANLTRWAAGLPGRGACGLLDAAAGIAGSLLRAFPALVDTHLAGNCPSCRAAADRDAATAAERLTVPVPGPGPSPLPGSACVPGPFPPPSASGSAPGSAPARRT
ncbi:NADH-ubiquinone oxidoreductase-F iron-sulfur binding region domain-containing protein [Streptomyces ficellus]|uniref:Fe-S-binding domain-containing protein n=1 Tax=Streptomyces ficellus TaxID=1977088 RepID=A0A6I6F7R5_9ACTN|nr:NADH-ubiquinone oxidoreductase-F iron-sulfur binding region domain-containing protein [Streptomyces ficellus]QGV77087.1 Fe-S-binding domain-containing protein [Streptomyces ficellus]